MDMTRHGPFVSGGLISGVPDRMPQEELIGQHPNHLASLAEDTSSMVECRSLSTKDELDGHHSSIIAVGVGVEMHLDSHGMQAGLSIIIGIMIVIMIVGQISIGMGILLIKLPDRGTMPQ